MKLARLFVIAVSLVTFGGCVLKGPEVRVGPPVEVKSEPPGRFCPPGQAKKGNC